MGTWTPTGPGRWENTTPNEDGTPRPRHLLIAKGKRLVELHGGTVHVYEGDGPIDNARPLKAAKVRRTEHRKDLAEGKGKNAAQAVKALEDLADEPVPDKHKHPEPEPEGRR